MSRSTGELMNGGVTARPKGHIKAEYLGGSYGPRRSATKALVSPERGLLAAVLGRAIYDLLGCRHVPEYRSAYRWFFCPEGEEEAFSFLYICRELELDAGVLVNIVGQLHDARVRFRAARKQDKPCLRDLLKNVTKRATELARSPRTESPQNTRTGRHRRPETPRQTELTY